MEATYEGFFFLSSNDDKLLTLCQEGLVESGQCTADDSAKLIGMLRRRPFRRWVFLNGIRAELEAEGFGVEEGRIDWEAIANFIVAIAPVILEIIMAILNIVP